MLKTEDRAVLSLYLVYCAVGKQMGDSWFNVDNSRTLKKLVTSLLKIMLC